MKAAALTRRQALTGAAAIPLALAAAVTAPAGPVSLKDRLEAKRQRLAREMAHTCRALAALDED